MSNENKNSTQEFSLKDIPRPLLVFVGFAIAVALAMLAAYVVRFAPIGPSNDQAHWGQFGDFLGGVLNPLVAFAALIALLYATTLQKKELSASKEALNRSAKAMEAQQEVLELQAFESTFFKLIENQGKLREWFDGLVTKTSGSEKTSLNRYDSLTSIVRGTNEAVSGEFFYGKGFPPEALLATIYRLDAAKQIVNVRSFEPYVQHFIFSIRFIGNANLSVRRKCDYFQLIRCTLDIRERILVLYYLLLNAGDAPDQLRDVMRAEVFDTLPPNDLFTALVTCARMLVNGDLQPPSPSAPPPSPAPTAPATEPA